jgi:hypothetical protein
VDPLEEEWQRLLVLPVPLRVDMNASCNTVLEGGHLHCFQICCLPVKKYTKASFTTILIYNIFLSNKSSNYQ